MAANVIRECDGCTWGARLNPFSMKLLLLFLCGLTFSGCMRAGDSPVTPGNEVVSPIHSNEEKPDNPAAWEPVFTDIGGHQYEPFRDRSKRAVALIFILPDCPIACSYIPELNRLWHAFREKGIDLFVIQADPQITVEQARKHAEEYQLQCPVLLDPNHALVKKTGVRRTPEAAVLSSNGELLYRGRINDQYVDLGKRRGQVTTQDLRDALHAIAAGNSVPQSRTTAVGCFIPGLSNGE